MSDGLTFTDLKVLKKQGQKIIAPKALTCSLTPKFFIKSVGIYSHHYFIIF